MKQGTLAICVAAALGVSTVSAFELSVNGETLSGVDVSNVSINGDVVSITSNVPLVAFDDPDDPDDDNDGVPDDIDNCPTIGPDEDGFGCPDTDDDGVFDDVDQCPNEGPDDDGFGCPDDDEPPPSGTCVDSATVECDYNVSTATWNSSARTTVRVTIPRGKTLVSSFDTSSNSSADTGTFSFTTPVSGRRESVDLWVSDSVLGNPISSRCDSYGVAYAYQIKTTTYSSFYCVLQPNQTYYLHVRHVDSNAAASDMYRELTTN